jgi:hypothetical protein
LRSHKLLLWYYGDGRPRLTVARVIPGIGGSSEGRV